MGGRKKNGVATSTTGARLTTEAELDPLGVTTEKADEFVQLFATYRSKRRLLEKRRFLNPAKRTEARQSLRDVMIGPETEEEAKANHIEKQGSRLFLNDDLTRSRAQLLYKCRQAKKTQLITDSKQHFEHQNFI